MTFHGSLGNTENRASLIYPTSELDRVKELKLCVDILLGGGGIKF